MKRGDDMKGNINVVTSYSFQKSTVLIRELVAKAKQLNIGALGICDHDNMYGALEFYHECVRSGIKPLIGLNASVLIESQTYPLLLYAKNYQGYLELVRITSIINTSGNNAIEIEQLAKKARNLHVVGGDYNGLIAYSLKRMMPQRANANLLLFKEYFKENFYLGISVSLIEMENQINAQIIDLANSHGVKVVGYNKVRYLEREDAFACDLLEASLSGASLSVHDEPNNPCNYLKSLDEVSALFDAKINGNVDEFIDGCNLSLDSMEAHLPRFPLAPNQTAQKYLNVLCHVGLKKRFASQVTPRYLQRLDYELKIIHEMGFDDYFLIVYDYVQYAKKNKILVGPGRGSAAGSLVSYCLGITNIDPIRYDLLFERFLNVDRISMPDIDIDFQDTRRDEVVNYVISKYGVDHVAGIVTFTTYGPRVAIKDLGKVMGLSLPYLEMLSKQVPTGPKNKKTIMEVYNTSNHFASLVDSSPAMAKILRSCALVERIPKNASTHAAGIVLSSSNLLEVAPVGINNGLRVVQYSKDYIEEAGFLKMDFLGLRNLSVIKSIVDQVEINRGLRININDIGFDDKRTFNLLSHGNTLGIFQLESSGMTDLIKRMQISSLEDIIAAIALYRPGPMENIPDYIARKKGEVPVDYIIDDLKGILQSTYGIMIYQEQIMLAVQKIASFSLSKADKLRKAMSKKQASLMMELKDEYIQGAKANGYSQDQANRSFDVILKFANYGFNKAHSVSYAYVAYYLAYLKANFPLEFYSAILTNDSSNTKTLIKAINECRKLNIKILPPSINYSYNYFSVENGNIRFSLVAIRNVGQAFYAKLEQVRSDRPFESIDDFIYRMDNKINAQTMMALIDSGCFKEFNHPPHEIKDNLFAHVARYENIKKFNLDKFALGDLEVAYQDDWGGKKQAAINLELEKQALGVYLSSHPLTNLKQTHHVDLDVIDLSSHINQKVRVLVNLTRVKVIQDKNGNNMAFIEGQDETASLAGVLFFESYQRFAKMLVRGSNVIIEGRVDYSRELQIIVNSLIRV